MTTIIDALRNDCKGEKGIITVSGVSVCAPGAKFTTAKKRFKKLLGFDVNYKVLGGIFGEKI